jgi:prepilin-type N-terminal cleavage/methylation domain-containing protein
MKIPQSRPQGFTLIELLVVISIIAILAGIALPVFGEVQVRGAQTKALSNAKQVGTACKLFAMDYNGNFPLYTDLESRAPASGGSSNEVLSTLIPDYLPDKGVFAIPKSAYCKNAGLGKGGSDATKLGAGENEWAYVLGLSDTSSARFPLLANGFKPGSTKYSENESEPGGVWKAKKAIVIRVDISGNVETVHRTGKHVKRTEENPERDAFQPGPNDNPPWFDQSVKVLNPTVAS